MKNVENLPEYKQRKERLAQLDKVFLDVLFKEAGGDFYRAKEIAGYPDHTAIASICKRLKDEIIEGIQLYAAANGPLAISTLIEIMTSPGGVADSSNKIKAAKEILNLAGLVKTEKKEVTYSGGVVMLPQKE